MLRFFLLLKAGIEYVLPKSLNFDASLIWFEMFFVFIEIFYKCWILSIRKY
jgi:hypothetical protein